MLSYEQIIYYDELWESKFELLLQYQKEYGTVNVPNRFYNEETPEWERKLGSWCSTQRRYFSKGKLKQWRFEKLISVGFEFSPNNSKFEDHYVDFLKFKKKYGHGLVPQDCKEFPGLGSWVSHLRTKNISEERRRRLDAVGFIWDAIDEIWQKRYLELIDFKDKYGHFQVPEKNPMFNQLATWVVRMRKAHNQGKAQRINQTQIYLLNTIEFPWDPEQYKWEKNIIKLKQFINENGHCLVPVKRCKIEGLGWFVSWVRKNKHKLSIERIDELDELGFEWNSDQAYRKRNGIKVK